MSVKESVRRCAEGVAELGAAACSKAQHARPRAIGVTPREPNREKAPSH